MTPKGINLRPAVAADLDAIREIAEAAYAPYVAAIGRKPAPMVADFAALILDEVVTVAEDAGLVGFAVCLPKADHMFLENVAVHPCQAGRGIGRALIDHIENEARRVGLPTIRLYTNAKMTANLTLYPRLGYVQTERRMEDGFDRVFFEKRLG